MSEELKLLREELNQIKAALTIHTEAKEKAENRKRDGGELDISDEDIKKWASKNTIKK